MKKILLLALLLALFLGTAVWAGEGGERKDPFLPLVLNIVPGFGLGSFIMQDPAGGLVGLGGEIVGIGLFVYGFGYIIAEAAAVGIVKALTLGYGEAEMSSAGGYFMVGGLIVWGATKIFEIVRPFWFASRYNSKLTITTKVDFTLVKSTEASLKPALLFNYPL